MRQHLSDPQSQLLRLLKAHVRPEPLFAGFGTQAAEKGASQPPGLVLESFEAQPWASLTFSGMRHCLDFRLDGAGAAVERVFETLSLWAEEPDCGLTGHFLAELQLAETAREISDDGRMSLSLRLEALTIEE